MDRIGIVVLASFHGGGGVTQPGDEINHRAVQVLLESQYQRAWKLLREVAGAQGVGEHGERGPRSRCRMEVEQEHRSGSLLENRAQRRDQLALLGVVGLPRVGNLLLDRHRIPPAIEIPVEESLPGVECRHVSGQRVECTARQGVIVEICRDTLERLIAGGLVAVQTADAHERRARFGADVTPDDPSVGGLLRAHVSARPVPRFPAAFLPATGWRSA